MDTAKSSEKEEVERKEMVLLQVTVITSWNIWTAYCHFLHFSFNRMVLLATCSALWSNH